MGAREGGFFMYLEPYLNTVTREGAGKLDRPPYNDSSIFYFFYIRTVPKLLKKLKVPDYRGESALESFHFILDRK